MLVQSLPNGLPQNKKNQLLYFLVCVLYLLQLVIDHPALWAFIGVGSVYVVLKEQPFFQQKKKLIWLTIGILTAAVMLNFLASPSHAVLLTRVQNFFSEAFTGAESEGPYSTIIDLICNSLRGFYILLIVIAGWGGWQDFQQNQEMGSFARNMLYSLAVIFSVDVISAFIVPA